jgi:hypothetical protein
VSFFVNYNPKRLKNELFIESFISVFLLVYLQDEGAIIVIHLYHVDTKSTILGYCAE